MALFLTETALSAILQPAQPIITLVHHEMSDDDTGLCRRMLGKPTADVPAMTNAESHTCSAACGQHEAGNYCLAHLQAGRQVSIAQEPSSPSMQKP